MSFQIKDLPMFKTRGLSLGEVCHIVQISIARKIVGYRKGGALVYYPFCDAAKRIQEVPACATLWPGPVREVVAQPRPVSVSRRLASHRIASMSTKEKDGDELGEKQRTTLGPNLG